MIYGDLDHCETVSLMPDGSLEQLAGEIREKYDRFHEEGCDVVCLCDLAHATPYNACCLALADTEARLISGMSVPLLLAIASGREDIPEGGLDEFLSDALEQSREMIVSEVIKDLMA
jgi:mannose/fructose-specific phosphotransferase system component IIA